MQPTMHGGSDARRERIRQRMREFYGDPVSSTTLSGSATTAALASGARAASLPVGGYMAGSSSSSSNNTLFSSGNSGGGSAASARRVPPEMDLDSEYFNVSRYTTDLLRRESLKGLVEVDTQLLRTVRQLDGELQELVYRNYAKFISATDTIREMRDSVAEMDGKLVALSRTVAQTDALSQRIAAQLRAHRSRIEQTMAANRMLKKVQFLVALPGTLRTLLERDALAVAVRYWVAGDGFLGKHAHLDAIAAIHDECRTLARQLYTRIEAAMCAIALDDPDGMDAVRCRVEDLRLLRATSLFARAPHAHAHPVASAASGGEEADVSFDEAVLRTLLRSVTASFVSGIEVAQRSLRSAIATTATTTNTAAAAVTTAMAAAAATSNDNSNVGSSVDAAVTATSLLPLEQRASVLASAAVREALAEVKSACALLHLNTERVYALLQPLGSGDDGKVIGMRVAQEVQPVLLDLLTPLQTTLTQLATTTLASIAGDGVAVLQSPRRVHEALQSATQALLQQLKHMRVTLRTLGQNYLDTAHSQQSAAYTALVDDCVAGVLAACATHCVHYADGAVTLFELSRYSAAAVSSAAAARGSGSRGGGGDEEEHDVHGVRVSPSPPEATAAVYMTQAQRVQQQKLCCGVVRLAYASLTGLLVDGVTALQRDADALPRSSALDGVVAALLHAGRALQHRGVVLLGQVSLQTVWPSAFGDVVRADDDRKTAPSTRHNNNNSSNNNSHSSSSEDEECVVTVSLSLLQLLQDWTTVYHVLRALPPPQHALASNNSGSSSSVNATATSAAAGMTTAAASAAAADVARDGRVVPSMLAGATPTAATRLASVPGTSGVAGLYVAHTQQEQAVLRSSIERLFAHDDAVLHTCPRDGKCGTTMWCIVVYTCKALVERVRAPTSHYHTRTLHRLQVNCTFLLRALLAPAKGSAARRWLRDWATPDKARTVHSLLDAVCVAAYAHEVQQTPHTALSNADVDRILDAAVLQASEGGNNSNSNSNNNNNDEANASGVHDADASAVTHDSSGRAATTLTRPAATVAESNSSSGRNGGGGDDDSKTATAAALAPVRNRDERAARIADDEELPL